MITQPYQLYIERTDLSRNMARYYAMDISETLFGETRLTRRWGRIGAQGQSKEHVFSNEKEAVVLFLDLLRRKRTRGYRPAGLSGSLTGGDPDLSQTRLRSGRFKKPNAHRYQSQGIDL